MESEITKIYSTSNEMQAKVVCGYLQAQGIHAFLRGIIPFAHPALQLQLYGGGRMIDVCVPTVEAATAGEILESFRPDEPSHASYVSQAIVEEPEPPAAEEHVPEEILRTLAVFNEREVAETCMLFLEYFDFHPVLKYYSEEERQGLPISSMIASAPWQILIKRKDFNFAGDKLLSIDIMIVENKPETPTSWACPECGAITVLLSHDPLKRSKMKKLLAAWILGLPFLLYFQAQINDSIGYVLLLSAPLWFLFNIFFENNRSCLHCKNNW